VETSLPWQQQERGPASASFCDECGPLRPVPVPCFLGKGYGLLQRHCPPSTQKAVNASATGLCTGF
jgi:hypothetical protein